jgi:hypothetical protein
MLDLYAITGIEQVRWMQNDLKDGKRNFDLCIDAMVRVSAQFPYIKDEDQKAIITRMMMEDKKYESLNARTIYAWLEMNKGSYFAEANAPEEIPFVELSDEEKANIDKIADEYKAKLIGQKLDAKGIEEDMKRIQEEDKIRIEGQKGGHPSTPIEKVAAMKLHDQYIRENYDMDGKKRECWTEESEWLELKGESLTP